MGNVRTEIGYQASAAIPAQAPKSERPRIGAIVLSYNDPRIIHTILSIRKCDKANQTRIYVIDGGSTPETVALIESHLCAHDVLTSEKDRGIFDALNKGLDLVQEDYMTWFGSDDFMGKDVDLGAVISALDDEALDCVFYDIIFVDAFGAKRRTVAAAPTLANFRRGLHVPHFASYWRMSTIGKNRFDLGYPIAADQDFFLRLIREKSMRCKTVNAVGTLSRIGGNSGRNFLRTLEANWETYGIFRRHLGPIGGTIAVIAKMAVKTYSKLTKSHYPVLDEFTALIVSR